MQDDSLLRSFSTIKPAAEKILSDGTDVDGTARYLRARTEKLQPLCEKGLIWTLDSLVWWKDNSDKYSKLSVLARRYLAVPSTSVPSERIFSAAGLIVEKLRNRLSSCINQIIFLNKSSVPQ
jgi:hypothetical protein